MYIVQASSQKLLLQRPTPKFYVVGGLSKSPSALKLELRKKLQLISQRDIKLAREARGPGSRSPSRKNVLADFLGKNVQAAKLKLNAKQKKEEIESVKKWRKQRQQSGFAKDDGDGGKEMDFSFEDGKAFERSSKKRPGVMPGDRSGGKMRQGGGKGAKKGQKKREFRNSKFGFGGRKGLKKQNTAETTNDFRAFNKGNASGNKKRKR